MRVEQRLVELGIELPSVPRPVANYVNCRRAGNLLFLQGVVATHNGEQMFRGKVGADVSVEEAYQAARYCALNHLAILANELGDLDRVESVVKLTGYINAAPGFMDIPPILDGASDLFVDVFGDVGKAARAGVGVAELAEVHPVETDLVVAIHG